MKTKLLYILFLFGITQVAFSQKVTSGSLNALKDQTRVNLEVDFSQAIIHGMPEDEFAVYERDWVRDKDQIIAHFRIEAADRCDKVNIGPFPNAEYTIKVIVLRINTKGDFTCIGEVYNKSGEIIANISEISDRGGRVGSKLNLIKDGAKHTGERFGLFLRKQLK